MTSLYHDNLGLFHLISAFLALGFGSLVLLLTKGTRLHRRWGFAYVVAMLALNISALMIYRLFNGFGPFHISALVSLASVVAGLVPAISKWPRNWPLWHFGFMYWSVIGLYAAFASEILTRVPETPFFGMVAFASGLIFVLGLWGYLAKRRKWRELVTAWIK